MPGLAAILIPLIPGMVEGIMRVVSAIGDDADTPAEEKAKLDAISADLKGIMAAVAAVQLPDKQ